MPLGIRLEGDFEKGADVVPNCRAPDLAVEKWQHRLTPAWRHIAGGCHLNRKMDEVIELAGFDLKKLQTGYAPGPRPMTFMYEGCACQSRR
jgi:hypothetical protein